MRRVLALNPQAKIFGALGAQMYLEALWLGALGTMAGFSFPDILVKIYRQWRSGDKDGAARTFYHICPLFRFENQQLINLPLCKHLYWKHGAIASPTARARGVRGRRHACGFGLYVEAIGTK